MSYLCEKCGKSRMSGHNVSHAKNRTVKYTVPNLHRVSLGRGLGYTRLCSTCLRTLKKTMLPQRITPSIV